MKKKITLNCEQGIRVEIEADVVGGIGIHRPVYFEIDENDRVVLDGNGNPVYEIWDSYWRLTHVSTGLSVMHARTKNAALKARKILKTIDLDYIAGLDEQARLEALPDNHDLRRMMHNPDVWLPPDWIWE